MNLYLVSNEAYGGLVGYCSSSVSQSQNWPLPRLSKYGFYGKSWQLWIKSEKWTAEWQPIYNLAFQSLTIDFSNKTHLDYLELTLWRKITLAAKCCIEFNDLKITTCNCKTYNSDWKDCKDLVFQMDLFLLYFKGLLCNPTLANHALCYSMTHQSTFCSGCYWLSPYNV